MAGECVLRPSPHQGIPDRIPGLVYRAVYRAWLAADSQRIHVRGAYRRIDRIDVDGKYILPYTHPDRAICVSHRSGYNYRRSDRDGNRAGSGADTWKVFKTLRKYPGDGKGADSIGSLRKNPRIFNFQAEKGHFLAFNSILSALTPLNFSTIRYIIRYAPCIQPERVLARRNRGEGRG